MNDDVPTASPHRPARRSRKLATTVTETVTDRVSGAGKQVRKARDSALKEIAQARSTAERAVGAANQIITEHPMTATATAVALGALFAYAFPGTSKKIRKAAPELAQSLIDTARSAQKALPDTDSFTKPAALAAASAAASVGRTVRKGPELARKAAQSGLSAVKDVAMDAMIQSGLADQAGELVEKAADSLARTAKKLRTPPANREK